MKIKNVFKIEYILISLSLLIFDFTAFLKIESQKKYVNKVLGKEINKRLGTDKDYLYLENLPDDWASYQVQKTVGEDGSPSEVTIRVINEQKNHDIVAASDEMINNIPEMMKQATQAKGMTFDTFTPDEYEAMVRDDE